MKKRKILMLTLPLVGVATIVGSGFSAWYFNETTVSTSAKLGVAVTELHVTAGTLTTTLPAGAKVVLTVGVNVKVALIPESFNPAALVVGIENVTSKELTFV